MKKFLSLLTALLLSTSLLIGCSDGASDSNGDESQKSESTDVGIGNNDTADIGAEISTPKRENASYLMIYNPEIYNENITSNDRKNTGDIAMYITPAMHRADGLDEERKIIPTAVDTEAFIEFMEEHAIEMNRATATFAPYSVGDVQSFYSSATEDIYYRTLMEFECKYAGKYCNVWVYNDWVSSDTAENFGMKFDNSVYEKIVGLFGEARFADNGHKVNILCSNMSVTTVGYVSTCDIFATGDDGVTQSVIEKYGVNLDHAIINMNYNWINTPEYEDDVFATLGHEFQHYICFTDSFLSMNGSCASSWLNEAMSGYAEGFIVKDAQINGGRPDDYHSSARIRHGQSLYNFSVDASFTKFDIGVYGSVFLFSEYLANIADSTQVYHELHDYWRNSYSYTVNDAEAIANIIPADEYARIDGLIEYPANISFATDHEELMSKMTLDFYISLLKYEQNDPEAYKYINVQNLLYDEINSANIEGGGRIIVELKDGEFDIPKNADTGLVYIWLDSNFEIIGDIECR